MMTATARSGIVYVLKCPFGIKIGYTQRRVTDRLFELSKKLDFLFLRAIRSDDAFGLELHLKRRFRAKQVDAWQTSEVFSLDDSDLQYIATLEEVAGYKCRHFTDVMEANLAA